MDRIRPTVRPSRLVIGHMDWHDLLFLHWEVPVDVVRPLVPEGLEVDSFDGRTFVGIVPFAMKRVRAALVPGALGVDTLETNVRIYVHHGGEEPGVHFLSVDSASTLAVAVARSTFGLPYHRARMRMERHGDEVEYESVRVLTGLARVHVRYKVGREVGPAAPDTIEHFLLERYQLYLVRGGRLWRMRVHHPPHELHRVRVVSLDEGLSVANGLPQGRDEPDHAHWSPAVDVEVFRPELV